MIDAIDVARVSAQRAPGRTQAAQYPWRFKFKSPGCGLRPYPGYSLQDPAGLFNASLDGNMRRAIDIHAGEAVDAAAFKALIREAIACNGASKPKRAKPPKS